MKLLENIHDVWHLIGRNKVRSFLTMLGIIIGVMSVIVIMSVGAGAQSLILNQVKSMGTNLIGVLPGKADEKGPPASVMGVVVTTLKYEDIEAALRDYPILTGGTVYVRGTDTVVWGDNKTDTSFVGTTADLPEVEDTKVDKGRFFTADEEKSVSRLAVLGSQTAKDLFGDESPLGQRIKIKKTQFVVIGVMKARGTSGFQNQDDQIFVPVTAAQKLLLGIDYVSMARLKVDRAENVDAAIAHIEMVLRDRHNIDRPEDDDFTVRSMAQGIEAITKITNALRLFLFFIAAISLLVGGIGIMNIMLAAVEERTREIGLRKAVGARNRHIVIQFLVETVMITLLGGLIGLGLGILISFVVAKVAQGQGYSWDFVIGLGSVVLAVVISVSIGLIFGIAPARRASRLDPIEALRYE